MNESTASTEQQVTSSKFDVVIESPKDVLKIAHSGLELLHTRKQNFDHHLCNKVIGCREMPGDRQLRPSHVTYLINVMMRGTFHHEWVNLIMCQFQGDLWRMNGQHTCMARLELPERWKDQGQVSMMTYEATSMEAMRELYSSIDRGAPRTKGNVVNSYLEGISQFEGASQSLVRLLAEGLAFWLWESGHERSKHDGDELAYLMTHNHKPLVSTVLVFAMEQPRLVSTPHMRRAPVVAAMYETFSRVAADSIQFWTAVRCGTGMDQAEDPRLKLRNALMSTKIAGSEVVSRSKSVDRETQYRWCINAFNRWRRGESMKQIATTKDRQRAK